ncbi:MAG: 4a-hydroxytetrahydrobiopterin dehydratase, partial [Chloroflexi bacterium]|nr:4a-hydroxytetrahydrobiopterin dehydratase [Chloroflexota bacterium]
MVTLMRERCVACRRDSPRVTGEEIAALQPQIPEWQMTETDGIKRLARAFKFRNFADALDFAATVADAAE